MLQRGIFSKNAIQVDSFKRAINIIGDRICIYTVTKTGSHVSEKTTQFTFESYSPKGKQSSCLLACRPIHLFMISVMFM